MKFSSKHEWTEELFYQLITFVDGVLLKQEIADFLGNDEGLKIETRYPMFKKIGGVNIEIGSLIIYETAMETCLALLNSFVKISNVKAPGSFELQQNFKELVFWVEKLNLPMPDKESCEGYILNNELVDFSLMNHTSTLQFKFKSSLDDIFTLYQFSFMIAKNRIFLLERMTY